MSRKLKYPLTPAEFEAIYSRVPRLTVEAVVRQTDGLILTQIAQGVLRGQWNLPGGTIVFDMSLQGGEVSLSEQATAVQAFRHLPNTLVREQREFLLQHLPKLKSA